MKHLSTRLVVAVALLFVAIGVTSAPAASAWTRRPIRVAGDDRFATAVALSEALYPDGAPTVVVASGESFADALPASALAGLRGAPLLLTGKDSVPDVVRNELRRLAPQSVLVLGGPLAVADPVVSTIGSITGVTPARMQGATRFDTAAAAASPYANGGTVFVASGTGFADGLTGGAAAARIKRPLLLSLPDALPTATQRELSRIQPSEIVVVGGSLAISNAVVTQLQSFAPKVTRLSGIDRFATGAAVAAAYFPNPPESLLVSGVNFADALTAGPAAALLGSSLLLTLPACVPGPSVARLQATGWPNITVIGGGVAVGPEVEQVLPCSPVPDGELASGVRLDTYYLDGPVVARVVTIDRARGYDARATTATGSLGGRLPTTEIARRWNAIVAVNGDFFLPDGQPAHALATGGRVVKAPAFVEDAIGFSMLEPHVSYGGTPHFVMNAHVQETDTWIPVAQVNDGDPVSNEVALYTPEGSAVVTPPDNVCWARLRPTEAARFLGGYSFQMHAIDDKGCGASPPSVDASDLIVTPNDASQNATLVKSLTIGHHLDVGWFMHENWTGLFDSIGSNTTLVHNAAQSDDVVTGDPPFYTTRAPRTAVGRLADGRDVLVTVDGRQPGYSVGMTPAELADFLVSIGVVEASNLDGGGSTTLVVKGILVNRPSDAAGERYVGTSLVLVPSGQSDPPPFTGSLGPPPPAPDPDVVLDPASLGGVISTVATRGVPLRPELATIARMFLASQHDSAGGHG